MAHTIAEFEIINTEITAVNLLWNLLEFYDEPIKLLLYKYGVDVVKKYFYYDYFIYINEFKNISGA
tara:strand:- start:21 stop:218 length:198 start_codon:yes stop_codon:yes gene_type:complete